MNLLVPPLVAAIALSAYVATLSKDRTVGDVRRMAADSRLRHHEVAGGLSVDIYPAKPTNTQITTLLAPFADVLTWRSDRATDTQGRIWVMTYLGGGPGSLPTAISDSGVAGIPFELQRLDFSSGTYGFWKAGTLLSTLGTLPSTIGPISFSGTEAPPAPDGAIMVATLCKLTSPTVLDCGPIE